MASAAGLRRIGHKGADAIAPGNTLESFGAAVEAGVDMIELDVLRPRSDFAAARDWTRAPAGPGSPGAEPLLVAHDWGDAARRDPMTLGEGLDAFTRSPLDAVEVDCDLKVAGREIEVLDAIRERGLTGRAMISTMEMASLAELRRLDPDVRLGWTYPRVTRAWDRKRWVRPVVYAAMTSMRRRLPAIARRRLPELGVNAMWAFHPLVTARLAAACGDAGVELIAWTVDDVARMRALAEAGVDGICTNDPRLFERL